MGCEIFGRRCLWWGNFVKGTSSRAFLGWKSKGIAEEVEERCLASVASSNNENAIPSVGEVDVRFCTYLYGVGSFRLRTLLGLLIVLTALLA